MRICRYWREDMQRVPHGGGDWQAGANGIFTEWADVGKKAKADPPAVKLRCHDLRESLHTGV